MSMISFTAGGINVAEIVGGLMQAERIPLNSIQTRQAAVRLQITALNSIKTGLGSVRTQALAVGSSFTALTATSSSAAVKASVGSAAPSGSLTFTVDQVAQAHGLRTSATVASASSPIVNAPVLALSTSAGALGIGSVRAGAGLNAGSYDLAVTQATSGASRSGTSPLAASTTIGPGNDTLQLEIDGVARSVTIAAGTYTPTGLAQAVNSALVEDGSHARAHLDHQGQMVLTTSHEGSVASLRVTGGGALGSLGLGVDATASHGTDGIVTIGGESVTVSSTAGVTLALPAGSGDLGFTVTSGLRVGTAKVAVVDTGDGSVASVANAINGAKIGASASAVRIADGAWTLQLSAGTTGTAGAIGIASDAFIGGLVETSSARDATITVGTGAGAYSITGRGNTFADVMPGVVLTTATVSTEPVTVSVARDDAAAAKAVTSLIERANVLLAQIATQTKSEPGSSGPLSGQNVVRQLANDVRNAVTGVVPGLGGTLASTAGITLTREGRLAFDEAKFLSALESDPDAVARLFGKGGTGSAGIGFGAAGDTTIAGQYAIEITTPATRATSGAVLTGGHPDVQHIAVRVGATTVNFEAAAGASANEIADQLRGTLAAAGLHIGAVVDAGGVHLKATNFGPTGNFEVSTDPLDPGAWQQHEGTTVAGTIDGRAAIGLGNTLRLLSSNTSGARGLEIRVDEGVTGPGTFDYQPGIAARVAALETRMTGENGSLTITGNGFEARIKAFNTQIERFEDRMVRLEARLVRQWSSIQTLLQSLQSQGDWLGSQISSMNRQPAR